MGISDTADRMGPGLVPPTGFPASRLSISSNSVWKLPLVKRMEIVGIEADVAGRAPKRWTKDDALSALMAETF